MTTLGQKLHATRVAVRFLQSAGSLEAAETHELGTAVGDPVYLAFGLPCTGKLVRTWDQYVASRRVRDMVFRLSGVGADTAEGATA